MLEGSTAVSKVSEEPDVPRAFWFECLLDTLSHEIYVFRADTLHFIEINQGARRALGYGREELLQRSLLDIESGVSSSQFHELSGPLRRAEKEKVIFETTHRRKDGSIYPVEVRLQLCQSRQANTFIAIATDVTERKSAENKLRHLSDSFPDAILILEEQLCIECNKSGLQMFQVASLEELARHWPRVFADDTDLSAGTGRRTASPFRQVLAATEFRGEVALRRANGDLFPAWAFLSPIMEGGRHLHQLILRDLTEQKRTEHALRESEERFSLAMAGANDGLWDWDLKTDAVYFSPRWKNMLGYEEHELANHLTTWSSSLHPDDLDRALREVDAYMKGIIDEYMIEFRMKHKVGHYVDILARGIIVRDENAVPHRFVGTHVDISERKKAEQLLQQRLNELAKANMTIKNTQAQLFQAEKMASIGELAAGIAHEINNPVGFVSSNIRTLMENAEYLLGLIELYTQLETRPADQALLKDIRAFKKQIDLDFITRDIHVLGAESEEGIARVIRIIKDLKSFSHMDQGEAQLSDLHAGLDSTLNIAHNEIKYKADVVKEYGDIPLVLCNPSQINQVFMNLLVNAAHAIEKYGRITVRSGRRGHEWVWVEISDTGGGIPDAIKTRIFEPFFTTKAVGKGTGLGLAISYRIVESHGGRIEVDSVVGQGSTFRIVLPIEGVGPGAALKSM